jgi:uncharacterized protein YgiM (DUF1202 family)
MRIRWLTFCLYLIGATSAVAAANIQYVLVADPYIEMHTGPAAGYPITHVVERDNEIGIKKRRTDWFLIVDSTGKEGWVSKSQLEQTLQPSGTKVDFPDAGLADYDQHRWEIGLMAGDFGGATSYTGYGSYGFSRHLSVEFKASQILGNFSDGWSAAINLTHTFVPEWRVSPFFSLGTGIINIEPKANLAQTTDRSDQVAIVGAGLKGYLSRRFMVRLEYDGYVVLSSRNDNEDVDEWKAGFAVFF